jgi:peptidoglycan/LPS O-acetylase OafA/YrhL
MIINIVILSFIVLSLTCARFIKKRLKERGILIITAAAYSAYVVYLFHRPFFSFISLTLDEIPSLNMGIKTIIIYLSLPLLFGISYMFQALFDKYILRKNVEIFTIFKR